MKRSHFIAALLGCIGIGKAQESLKRPLCSDLSDGTIFNGPCQTERPIDWKGGKALNNQCPVCGTMATVPEPRSWFLTLKDVNRFWFVGDDVETVKPVDLSVGQPFRPYITGVTHCKKCNAAFFRDIQ